MPPDRDSLIQELQEQARRARERSRESGRAAAEAQEHARETVRRAQLLRRFSRQFRGRDLLPRRCAWCGRIEVGGEFVAPEEFLRGDLPKRIVERATHGICPDCADAASREAAETRPRGD